MLNSSSRTARQLRVSHKSQDPSILCPRPPSLLFKRFNRTPLLCTSQQLSQATSPHSTPLSCSILIMESLEHGPHQVLIAHQPDLAALYLARYSAPTIRSARLDGATSLSFLLLLISDPLTLSSCFFSSSTSLLRSIQRSNSRYVLHSQRLKRSYGATQRSTQYIAALR